MSCVRHQVHPHQIIGDRAHPCTDMSSTAQTRCGECGVVYWPVVERVRGWSVVASNKTCHSCLAKFEPGDKYMPHLVDNRSKGGDVDNAFSHLSCYLADHPWCYSEE
jgi:hypothetical protein